MTLPPAIEIYRCLYGVKFKTKIISLNLNRQKLFRKFKNCKTTTLKLPFNDGIFAETRRMYYITTDRHYMCENTIHRHTTIPYDSLLFAQIICF